MEGVQPWHAGGNRLISGAHPAVQKQEEETEQQHK
jgi:hypothetical protein